MSSIEPSVNQQQTRPFDDTKGLQRAINEGRLGLYSRIHRASIVKFLSVPGCCTVAMAMYLAGFPKEDQTDRSLQARVRRHVTKFRKQGMKWEQIEYYRLYVEALLKRLPDPPVRFVWIVRSPNDGMSVSSLSSNRGASVSTTAMGVLKSENAFNLRPRKRRRHHGDGMAYDTY